MARLLYPDVADRTTQRAGVQYFGVVAAGTPVAVYTDEAGTTPADIRHEDGSAVSGGSPLVTLAGSLLPLFQGPDAFTARLYVTAGGGDPWPVRPQLDELAAAPVTSVAGRIGAVVLTTSDVGGLGSAATHPAADFDAAGAASAVAASTTTALAGKANTSHSHTVTLPLGTVTFAGTLAVAAGVAKLPVDAACTVVGVYLAAGTAPTGAAIVVDVNKNGTTIFTTQGNRPTIAAAAMSGGPGATPNITALAAGDLVTVDVDQVGSSVAGGGPLTVSIVVSRAVS